ncbi:MAG: hypothetical protein JWN96_143 [Mycobacterium sp.]|nr:hypothetical protein [Mycobacterium sp.]
MRSDDKPQLSIRGRRRIAVCLAGLVAAPALLLVACGNADRTVNNDNRPDPKASTEGAIVELPQPVGTDSALNSPDDGIPPEDLVSQQGFGERDGK